MANLYEIQQYNNRKEGDRQKELYNYYTGNDVPIDKRQPVSSAKAESHTNLHIDFFKDIVELKVGYMAQKITPVVNVDSEELKKRLDNELKSFARTNSLHTMNSESVRWSSISGKSHRLCYSESKVFKIKNATVGLNYPPMHVNCRSTTISKFDDEVFERRARDPKTGKTYTVPSDMKYAEWAKIYL